MDRAEEFAFAWALLDEASALLNAQMRVQMCVRMGAGEYRETITALLQHFTDCDAAVPPALSASLWAWVNGFIGSDSETALRTLASRIRVSNVIATVDVNLEQQHQPAVLVPRRSERATRRLVLAESSNATGRS